MNARKKIQRRPNLLKRFHIGRCSKSKLKILLKLCKESLNVGGILVIFSLKTKDNRIPCFKKMKQRLDASLKRDEMLLKIIKRKLKIINYENSA